MAKCEPKYKELDYALPAIEYGQFNTVRRVAGELGSTVIGENIDASALALAVGDSTIIPFELVGPDGCPISAEAEFTRLTAGGTDISLNTVASLIRNFGGNDFRITLRILPDCFGNVGEFDWIVMPSQMGGNQERFVIQFNTDTPPDDYIRGAGNPTAVNLPLTANLIWGNNNNTGHSSFRYNGRSEITFRLNGQNAVSNVTSIGLLTGPQTLEYDVKDILGLVKRIIADPEDNSGSTTAPTLPLTDGSKTSFNFQDTGNFVPFNLQIANTTNAIIPAWQALIENALYELPVLAPGPFETVSSENSDGTFNHLFRGTGPLQAFENISINGDVPEPSNSNSTLTLYC